MSVPATVVYFVGYDHLKTAFAHSHKQSNAINTNPMLSLILENGGPAFAGALARSIAASVISPLELVRTRMQSRRISFGSLTNGSSFDESIKKGKEIRPYQFIMQDLKGMIQREGFLGLWKGLVPTLWRDVPFSALYWSLYERFKIIYRNLFFSRDYSTQLMLYRDSSFGQNGQEFYVSFFAGLTSGAIAAFLTTPFDVVKTRRQAEGLFVSCKSIIHDSSHGSMENKGLAICSHRGCTKITAAGKQSLPFVYLNVSIGDCLKIIWREEGFSGLFSGVSARMIKVAPACAIMISSYEIGKHILATT